MTGTSPLTIATTPEAIAVAALPRASTALSFESSFRPALVQVLALTSASFALAFSHPTRACALRGFHRPGYWTRLRDKSLPVHRALRLDIVMGLGMPPSAACRIPGRSADAAWPKLVGPGHGMLGQ